MDHGPVKVLFLTLPARASLGDALADVVGVLRKPADDGLVRFIDCVLMLPGDDGTVAVVDLEEQTDLPPELAGLGIDPHDLLSDLDIEVFVASLGEGEVGVALVYEEVWARTTVTALRELGAEVALFAHIPGEDVDRAFAAAAAQS
ncbi:DUF6325 family protein [Nocardioides sp. YIM 152315]|uniref:DUF6325 family protein n=1 Tax=Nocardioides sp. YIM 152315 TaxID=3031760 RepID=UPI0023D994A1|nr:DUF6325 family protein [Nocardioides sp. YIM 152315]MDF1602873.1 DUF6325 family protein [Nocardioides sp. YIM 152315]